MNGNFVQRGEAAIFDKWIRTKMALANGVDMVIELPLVYGIRSAEYFASGAVSLLEKSRIVDFLVFGSESGEIRPLQEIAHFLSKENKYYQKILKKYLSAGYPFPQARELAVKNHLELHPDNISIDISQLREVISEPNNLLGIEYLKALKNLNSGLTPFTIKRKGSQYHDPGLQHKIASATAIRKRIYLGKTEDIKEYLPELSNIIIKDEITKGKFPINLDLLGMMIISTIRKHNRNTLSKFAEINNGLENRIYNEAHQTADLKELISNIKTRAFTWTRIQRNLLHILFDIKENDFALLDQYGVQYLRILGIRKERTDLLAKLKDKAELEIILNPSEYLNEINTDYKNPLIKSLSYDIMAGDIYSLLYNNPDYRKGHLDFTTPLIKY